MCVCVCVSVGMVCKCSWVRYWSVLLVRTVLVISPSLVDFVILRATELNTIK